MTYRTHKAAGCLAMFITFQLMLNKYMLSPDINPFLQLMVMYPAASFGSIAPDDDLASCPEKTPLNLVLNKLVRMTGAKHRSWQTHSLLISVTLCYIGVEIALNMQDVLNPVSVTILRLIIMGFTVGLLSHFAMDLLNPEGIWLLPGVRIHIFNGEFFHTGGVWEKSVRICLYIAIVIWAIQFVMSMYNIQFTLPKFIT